MGSAWDHRSAVLLRAGARIANARGIPGTLGCFALTLDEEKPVMLTSEHVLFGAGAREQEPVWLPEVEPIRVARTRHGRRGTVRHASNDVYVDCATAELELANDSRFIPESAAPAVSAGDTVHKVGASTGTTRGTISDAYYSETVSIGGRNVRTSGQILVRSENPAQPFNAAGDSGAALRNEDGAVVGLLWGVSASGDALACPIAPVLWLLNIRLARIVSSGPN